MKPKPQVTDIRWPSYVDKCRFGVLVYRETLHGFVRGAMLASVHPSRGFAKVECDTHTLSGRNAVIVEARDHDLNGEYLGRDFAVITE